MRKKTLKLFAVTTSFAFLVACQKSNQNDLQDAQLCLNKASSSEAMNCVSKLDSDYSENAYKLRCSAVFLSQGFGISKFSTAIDQIKNGNNGSSCTSACSNSVVAMTTLNFGATQAAVDMATRAFSECSRSGVKTYSMLSSIVKLGTDLNKLAGGSIDPNALQSRIASLDDTTVGQIVNTTLQTACANSQNAPESTQKYCSEMEAAKAAGATDEAIGACLKKKMANPSATCP